MKFHSIELYFGDVIGYHSQMVCGSTQNPQDFAARLALGIDELGGHVGQYLREGVPKRVIKTWMTL